ncbi:MAG: prepilin-type N-terminal cleavage/methylation domain-containing protein [Thermoguttaceae bacterium]
MNVSKRHKRARGVTLVELLVVVTILMMLAAFAIPTMRGLTEGRKVREAARAIDVYLTQAKIRALELQRPVGVVFQRTNLGTVASPDIQTDACTVLRQVEVPPPYAGDTLDARICLTPDDVNDPNTVWTVAFTQCRGGGDGWRTLVKEGDRLQLNFQGPEFKMAFPAGQVEDATDYASRDRLIGADPE